MNRRTTTIVCFSEIFNFAEAEFGIPWNPCNDLFFGTAFEYKQCQEWYAEELPDGYKTMSKEEVLALEDYDKAHVITELFMISEGLQDQDVSIDSQ